MLFLPYVCASTQRPGLGYFLCTFKDKREIFLAACEQWSIAEWEESASFGFAGMKRGGIAKREEACVTEYVQVIVITGNMGSGKTTILAEASDLLAASGVVHAAVDLDTLGMGHLTGTSWPELSCWNLSCVWRNYAAAGASRLLIAEAVENRYELTRIQEAVPGADIVVCRLTAALETLRRRVSQREIGVLHDTCVARVDELQVLIDRAHLENFTLSTDDGSSATHIAREVLRRAHWM
jgi:hypothetical protein